MHVGHVGLRCRNIGVVTTTMLPCAKKIPSIEQGTTLHQCMVTLKISFLVVDPPSYKPLKRDCPDVPWSSLHTQGHSCGNQNIISLQTGQITNFLLSKSTQSESRVAPPACTQAVHTQMRIISTCKYLPPIKYSIMVSNYWKFQYASHFHYTEFEQKSASWLT